MPPLSDKPLKRVAVFDLDGTILRGNSWQGFFFWLLRVQPAWAPSLLCSLAARYLGLLDGPGLRRRTLMRFRGCTREQLTEIGERFVSGWAVSRVRPAALRAIQSHKAAGEPVILVSAAFEFIAEPLARHLGMEACLSTRLHYLQGQFSGHLEEGELRGEAKLRALRALLDAETIDWPACTAYADEADDLPLLRQLGKPVFIGRQVPERLREISGLRCEDWK